MSYYIYKICCDNLPDFVYVGSTKAFRQRKTKHKSDYNNMKDLKLYQTIRENGGWDNWRMVIIEECSEISFTQAKIKEEEHRVKLNANLNMKKCHVSEEGLKEQKQEYYENNKEHIKEYNKEYYENNKERIKEYRETNKEKLTEKFDCDCGGKYTKDGKAYHLKTNKHLKYVERIKGVLIKK